MNRLLHRLGALCSHREISQFWSLAALCVLMAFLDVAGVALVLPFLELAADPDALNSNEFLSSLSEFAGLESAQSMIIALACLALTLVILSSVLAVICIWFQQKIAWTISHNISMRLVKSYATLPYSFFLNRDSSDLIRSTIDDISNLVEGVVLAGCQIISQLLLALFIFVLLLSIQPVVALTALSLFCVVYVAILLSRKTLLANLGRESLQTTSDRYRTFVDLVNGIKAIKSNGAKEHFVARFEGPSYRYSMIYPLVALTASVPRYLVETLTFGSIVAVIIYLSTSETGFLNALPTLTLFTLAGYRLIPAIHGAYVSSTRLLNSYPAIDSIYEDINTVAAAGNTDTQSITFSRSIQLQNISFTYTNVDQAAIEDVTLSIAKGSKVALVGPSGSGKTTLVDIIMLLLAPQTGRILVDDQPLHEGASDSWRSMIGYVPQDVFLYNESIARNIAFGADPVDMQKVAQAAKVAQIADFIEIQLPQQYDTMIGERGVRLSGGQRQRLGLARALYRSPDILILDEATSALDSITEGAVVRAIHEEVPNVTIIMIAHRIATVTRCDRLYLLDHGRIIAAGSYHELLQHNPQFRDLARFD